MRITIDGESTTPAHVQIVESISALTASGALPVGTKLPTVRQLARDLGVSPGTVARSYQELEAAGILATAGRRGTSVAARPEPAEPDSIATSVHDLVRDAKGKGVGLDEVLGQVRRVYESDTFRTQAVS